MTEWSDLKRHGYRAILIDPPSKFAAGTKGRPQHYKRMTDQDIAQLPLRDLAHPDGCWVFCWATSPKLKIIFDVWQKGWRCKYSGRAFVWIKLRQDMQTVAFEAQEIAACDLHMGTGYTTRKNAEDVLLFKFGTPARASAKVREVIIAPRREHSRKPDEIRDRICEFTKGPYLELFARSKDPRFDHWGDETDKF